MFKNYFKTALRNLFKNRTYSFLNIAGLATGITCAALIFLWVEDELTFNDYFSNKEYLYKVKDRQEYDGKVFTFDATPGVLAAGMKAEIPGFKKTARATWNSRALFSLGDKAIYEQGIFVDSAFLTMFSLEFINGSVKGAFDQLYSIVISESMAKKFFGTIDVAGKTLLRNNSDNYKITGVFRDLPNNVSFKFNWLAPFKIHEDANTWLQEWGNNGIITYAEVLPNANVEEINKKLDGYVQTKSEGAIAKMSVYPMTRWRMYDTYDNGKEIPGRIKYINLFSLIAWIILIIACINFMNLSTARSEQRAREVGVRKVLGAGKKKLMAQFIGEAMFMSVISSLIALGLIYLLLPAFNTLVDKKLVVDILKPGHFLSFFAITILCGLIAGSYPAFYLSSFNPIAVLKGLKIRTGNNTVFIRKGLVILQFSISVVLIISTIIIYSQIQFVKERNLGVNKENLIYMNVKGNIKKQFNVIRNDLVQTGYVQNAALSDNMVLQLGSNSGDFTWEGKQADKDVLITLEHVTPEYISTMGMKLKEGRDFYPDMKADSNNVIINETLAEIINRKEVIGSTISRESGAKFTIVGVIRDFVYNDMYSPAAPLILFSDTSGINVISIRIKPDVSLTSAIPAIEGVVKKNNPGYPVEYEFVDKEFEQYFKTETLIGKLAGIFAALAIFISCLGLFGLAAYTAEKRTKEIGIRKVLGASVTRIATLLSGDFLKLVAISFVIAFPVGWYYMHNWLQDYEYRISISWGVFVFAGLIAAVIAIATVSFQAIKAALANPVRNLRTE
jgi:putative ABC transport system permease protein